MKRKYEGEKSNMERGESMRFSKVRQMRTKKTTYEKQEKNDERKAKFVFRQCKK